MYVCLCNGVTEKHISAAVSQGATRLMDLKKDLQVTVGCGRCASCARQCLKSHLAEGLINGKLDCPKQLKAKGIALEVA